MRKRNYKLEGCGKKPDRCGAGCQLEFSHHPLFSGIFWQASKCRIGFYMYIINFLSVIEYAHILRILLDLNSVRILN